MRILQVCPYDWHAPGGVQSHVAGLVHALERRGHEVRVIAPGSRRSAEPGVEIVGRPIRVRFNGTAAPICPNPLAGRRVQKVVRAFVPDVVHAHEPLAPSLALFATVLSRAPVVATFHAHCDAAVGPWLYGCATWVMNGHVTAGMAVSRAATRCLSRRVRVPFEIVPNGVDPRFFRILRSRRGGRRILYAHRLEPRKGFGIALHAFARVADRFPDAELAVVGEGAEGWRVKSLAPALRGRVRMLGVVTPVEFAAQLAAAAIFIAPAVWGESFGVVLLEAMAAGVPVIASDVDGYRDVVRSGRDGLLVPPGNPDALADAIARVLGCDAAARRLEAAGRARAADYSWDRIVERIEDVYQRAMNRRAPRY